MDGISFKKTISSSGNHMLIQMLTNKGSVAAGFRAKFHYKPIQLSCANWLNMAAQLLQSPDYLTLECSWVITAPSIDSTIGISFNTFEVKVLLYQFHTLQIVSVNPFQLGNIDTKLKIYNGGSDKDELLFSETGNWKTEIKSVSNQIFIIFTNGGNGTEFTAKFTFGNA